MTPATLIDRLAAIEKQLVEEAGSIEPLNETQDGAVIARLLRKLGQHQMRATQVQEQSLAEMLRTAAEQRSAIAGLQERARHDRLAVLEWIDGVDDALVLARQHGDPLLLSWFDRILARGLSTAATLGLSEILGADRPLDPATDEVLDTVTTDAVQEGTVVEVVRRGFRWDGALLRRTQVIVAKGGLQ
ncbi:MAG TPA: nucleotide exchange factor GrpE [Gemmatimonadales bacterium]|nr:nucleotide exchange factor GrpE [Gemmatimonadales bacterium]